MKRSVVIATVACIVTGCELGSINVPPTDPIVVVQAVMRPDRSVQWILVEQTLTGRTFEQPSVNIVPSNGMLQSPVTDARVFVSNLSLPNDPCGPVVEFGPDPPPGEPAQDGVYWSPVGCPTMRPGDTLALHVEALDSVVTGRTEIPGFTAAVLATARSEVSTPAAELEFNRDTDTLTASVRATHGRAIHIELHPTGIVGRDSATSIREAGSWFWVDSTAMTLPGDFINFFEGEFESDGGSAPDLFIAGFDYTVTTSFMDENLLDSYATANFPLSGRGYVNSLSGGFGLFGSLVAQPNALRVIGNVDDPREGNYRLSGVVEGEPVELQLELYVGRQWIANVLGSPFGAFAIGTWVEGSFDASVAGAFPAGNQIYLEIPRSDLTGTWRVFGFLSDSGASDLQVMEPRGPAQVGTVTLVKQ